MSDEEVTRRGHIWPQGLDFYLIEEKVFESIPARLVDRHCTFAPMLAQLGCNNCFCGRKSECRDESQHRSGASLQSFQRSITVGSFVSTEPVGPERPSITRQSLHTSAWPHRNPSPEVCFHSPPSADSAPSANNLADRGVAWWCRSPHGPCMAFSRPRPYVSAC